MNHLVCHFAKTNEPIANELFVQKKSLSHLVKQAFLARVKFTTLLCCKLKSC